MIATIRVKLMMFSLEIKIKTLLEIYILAQPQLNLKLLKLEDNHLIYLRQNLKLFPPLVKVDQTF